MKARTTPPLFNDPVVVDGRKYRIHSIRPSDRTAQLHDRFAAGANGKIYGGRPNGPTVKLASLTWDAIAGVWRVPA